VTMHIVDVRLTCLINITYLLTYINPVNRHSLLSRRDSVNTARVSATPTVTVWSRGFWRWSRVSGFKTPRRPTGSGANVFAAVGRGRPAI